MPLYSFPEPCHALPRLLLFLVGRHRRLLQRALSFVCIIVVVPLTDNSSPMTPILSASPPASDNDSYDPIYYVPGENNGSIYTAESVVSKIPFRKSEYDQGVGYNPQPPAFVRQLVRSFVWIFFLVTHEYSLARLSFRFSSSTLTTTFIFQLFVVRSRASIIRRRPATT